MNSTYTPIIILALLAPSSAYAYLDPGTGSMILQGLIAGIAVAGATIKLYWHHIVSIIGKKKRPDQEEDETI